MLSPIPSPVSPTGHSISPESSDESANMHRKMEPEVLPNLFRGVGRHTNKLHWFNNIVIPQVAEKSYASVFLKPIQNPEYYEIIQNPMDIGSIRKRIENRYYQGFAEAVTDFRIMLENCFTFFGHEDPVYKDGMQMAKFFLEIMNNRPKGRERTRSVNLEMEGSDVAKKGEPDTWQSQCWAKLGNIRSLTKKLDMPVACLLIRQKCDSLDTQLSQGYFATLEEFTEELGGSFKDFCKSSIDHIQNQWYSEYPKKPRLEEPNDDTQEDRQSPKREYSSGCSSSSDSICSPDSSFSLDPCENSPTKSEKSYVSSSSFIYDSSSSCSDSSDDFFSCSNHEISSESSE